MQGIFSILSFYYFILLKNETLSICGEKRDTYNCWKKRIFLKQRTGAGQ